jgi:aspartate aminotransferase
MPSLSPKLAAIPYSVFESVNQLLARLPATAVIPLHQGKTWFAPLGGVDGGSLPLELAVHQHAPSAGIARLRAQIAEHLAVRHGLDAQPDQILITAGATHAVSIVLHAALCAEEEVIVASPQWLFTVGLIESTGARAVEVPIFHDLAVDSDHDFIAALDRAVTSRTRALYLNTPNNPTGVSLRPDQLAAVAAWARRRDLWLIADNAYENYDYSGWGFRDLARDAPERTFSVYTFSKTYAMPGWRIGFGVCPPDTIERLRKWGLYSVYSIATASQQAASAALTTPGKELEARRAAAQAARDLATAHLAIPHTSIQGGLYAWLNLSGWRGGDGELFVKRCAEAGIGLAPGRAFGVCGAGYARLCFTAVPPDRLGGALEILNTLYVKGAF